MSSPVFVTNTGERIQKLEYRILQFFKIHDIVKNTIHIDNKITLENKIDLKMLNYVIAK